MKKQNQAQDPTPGGAEPGQDGVPPDLLQECHLVVDNNLKME